MANLLLTDEERNLLQEHEGEHYFEDCPGCETKILEAQLAKCSKAVWRAIDRLGTVIDHGYLNDALEKAGFTREVSSADEG